MAVAAHPDNIERWCAGTLAQAIDMGATVRLLLVTSGEVGSSDPHATRERVSAQREREAASAARRLGIAESTFLREPDGAVENTASLRRALVRMIGPSTAKPGAGREPITLGKTSQATHSCVTPKFQHCSGP